jgi:Protein of unknown function (DUF3300)
MSGGTALRTLHLALAALFVWFLSGAVNAQETAAAPPSPEAAVESELKSAEELEILVAPIALYPDDLVGMVLASSLYPLQVVQAQRFLDQSKTNKDLKPNASWDGSVISLLNYSDIVKLMNDDLAWTEELGTAVTNQQKDVLVAIQQLRDKAVAAGAIKSDDKVIVENNNQTIVIKSAKEEVTYVPQYDPQVLLQPGYVATQPIYYGDPYPSYYYPYAPYWPGFVAGAVWGSIIDWGDWGCWGGDVDIDIDNINIDRDKWQNRDRVEHRDWNRDKGNLNFDRSSIANNLKTRNNTRLDRKADTGIKKARDTARPGGAGAGTRDVRRDVQQGLARPDGKPGIADRPGAGPGGGAGDHIGQGGAAQRSGAGPGAGQRPSQRPAAAQRPAAKQTPAKKAHAQRPAAKPAARPDPRPRQPSALGDYGGGQRTHMASQRGRASHMGRGGGGGGPRFGGGGRGGGGRGGGRR